MTLVIKETVNHYHKVEIEDEVDFDALMRKVDKYSEIYHKSGYEALERALRDYEYQFRMEWSVQKNYCGTETVDMQIEDIIES